MQESSPDPPAHPVKRAKAGLGEEASQENSHSPVARPSSSSGQVQQSLDTDFAMPAMPVLHSGPKPASLSQRSASSAWTQR